MRTARRFMYQNGRLALSDGIALYLAIERRDDIAVRQLLREYEVSYPMGYGKQVATKTIMLLNDAARGWLKELY